MIFYLSDSEKGVSSMMYKCTEKRKVDRSQKNKATYHNHFFKLTQLATDSAIRQMH